MKRREFLVSTVAALAAPSILSAKMEETLSKRDLLTSCNKDYYSWSAVISDGKFVYSIPRRKWFFGTAFGYKRMECLKEKYYKKSFTKEQANLVCTSPEYGSFYFTEAAIARFIYGDENYKGMKLMDCGSGLSYYNILGHSTEKYLEILKDGVTQYRFDKCLSYKSYPYAIQLNLRRYYRRGICKTYLIELLS